MYPCWKTLSITSVFNLIIFHKYIGFYEKFSEVMKTYYFLIVFDFVLCDVSKFENLCLFTVLLHQNYRLDYRQSIER